MTARVAPNLRCGPSNSSHHHCLLLVALRRPARVTSVPVTHIDPKSLICGYPALVIRDLLRLSRDPYAVQDGLFVNRLGITRWESQILIRRLVREGYLAPAEPKEYGWTATAKGRRLAIANAARQIRRSTADRLLRDLVARMNVLATHPEFLYRVTEAFVFGSYNTSAEKLSDLDIAFRVAGITEDREALFELERKRMREVGKRRTFNSFFDELAYPQTEVVNFLRNRSPYIELHNLETEAIDLTLLTLVRIYP